MRYFIPFPVKKYLEKWRDYYVFVVINKREICGYLPKLIKFTQKYKTRWIK